jgi:hypothetical protein
VTFSVVLYLPLSAASFDVISVKKYKTGKLHGKCYFKVDYGNLN